MVTIRPETAHDYADIAAVNVRAFGARAAEATIIALGRQRRAFDPELSLVAEIDGHMAGHVLFSPHTVRLMGEDVRAVNLAPIAVDPAFQRQGVGAALITEGHRIARSKGYSFSFLLGHTSYYPRFGYRTNSFGPASAEWDMQARGDLRAEAGSLQSRAPLESDVPALHGLWRWEEYAVDFTLDPGVDLLDWLSPNPAIQGVVYLREQRIVGYVRLNRLLPGQPTLFLAADADAARGMIGLMGKDAPLVTLPLHPASTSAGVIGQARVETWAAAMACSLLPGAFDAYYEELQAGERISGRLIWPVMFEIE